MSDGPDLLDYTRERIETLERTVEQRFAGTEAATALALRRVDDRFAHVEQLFNLGQDNAQRAVDKAEAAQQAHNVSQNEWRATLTDFRSNVISRQEFENYAKARAQSLVSIMVALGALVVAVFMAFRQA